MHSIHHHRVEQLGATNGKGSFSVDPYDLAADRFCRRKDNFIGEAGKTKCLDPTFHIDYGCAAVLKYRLKPVTAQRVCRS